MFYVPPTPKKKKPRARVKAPQRIAQHGKLCTYCARPMDYLDPSKGLFPTKDHVEPASKGGRVTVWACSTCNFVKRDMSEDAWAIYRGEHPEWWLGARALRAKKWTPRPSSKHYRAVEPLPQPQGESDVPH